MRPSLSIILPVLHEAATINAAVDHALALPYGGAREVIVADGADRADTLCALAHRQERGAGRTPNAEDAEDATGAGTGRDGDVLDGTVLLVRAPKGRARQMNAGAALARGELLLFLHADTRLPKQGLELIADALAGTGAQGPPSGNRAPVAGAFGLELATERPVLRLLARLSDLRNRLTRTPYGDQAQFFRADAFRKLGGFAEIPIMEDVEIMRRLRHAGRRVVVLRERARTSARRWEAEGPLRATLRNLALRTLYGLGASPEFLARWYRPHGAGRVAAATDPASAKDAMSAADATGATGTEPGRGPHGRAALRPSAATPGPAAATKPGAAPATDARRAPDAHAHNAEAGHAGPHSPDAEAVILFVREPEPGRVKTRLARSLAATAGADGCGAAASSTDDEPGRPGASGLRDGRNTEDCAPRPRTCAPDAPKATASTGAGPGATAEWADEISAASSAASAPATSECAPPGQTAAERAAADLYAAFVRDILAGLARVGAGLTVAHHPAHAPRLAALLGPETAREAQQGADLGQRMDAALTRAFARGAERAVLLGSDLPGVPPEAVRAALDALRTHDAVLGPAEDGGYWLIGFTRSAFAGRDGGNPDDAPPGGATADDTTTGHARGENPPQRHPPGAFAHKIFAGVAWGTANVAGETLRRLDALGARTALAATWRDVDDAQDLRELVCRAAADPALAARIPQTLAALRALPEAWRGLRDAAAGAFGPDSGASAARGADAPCGPPCAPSESGWPPRAAAPLDRTDPANVQPPERVAATGAATAREARTGGPARTAADDDAPTPPEEQQP